MISADDVRALHAAAGDAVLVILGGKAMVVQKTQLGTEEYAGALQVIDRDELVGRLGDDPSDHDVQEQAGVLDSTVADLGA